jgi:glycosyltransferase involved in cell wall biosynthesis
MRIAQVAPLYESVPPRLYGGTERVVSYLTDELVRLGHHVTLFASGDSRTSATLVPACREALRLSGSCTDHLAPHLLMVEKIAQRAREFDLIHFHIGQTHFPVLRRMPSVAHVTTLHGRLDLEELRPLYRDFADIPVVSISDAQRRPLPGAGWISTVYHGLPVELFTFHAAPGSYLAFLGRISPEKRVDRAIAIATACRQPLRIAAKVDPADRDYFDREVAPLLDNPFVEFIGEIADEQKSEFLGRAKALLFPIDWPEPFGLVMVEALACGLPVIAFPAGSVPELIDHGVTGFIVDSVDDAIDAVCRVESIDRRACRKTFEKRFAVRRMASDYVEVYQKLVGTRSGMVA